MEGENFVSLKGKIQWAKSKTVGEKNSKLFQATLVMPIGEREQYQKIAGWHSVAENLDVLPPNAFIHVHGHIESRSYDGKCKHCNGVDKKYWTEVVVDNFVMLGDGDTNG